MVYRAQRTSPGTPRQVAIKAPLESADGQDRQRFRLESEAWGRVRHRRVAKVHSVGVAEERPYLVMDWLDGETLADWIARGPLEPRLAARTLLEVARGVAAAHAHGLLHRGLCPRSVLLTGQGEPLVTDFGLVPEVDVPGIPSTVGVVLGVPGFLSPEQLAGELERVDRRADVYGLGALLYCALTGSAPAPGSTPQEQINSLQRAKGAPSLDAVLTGLPESLDVICQVALARDPSERYVTATAFGDDLERFLDDQPIAARLVATAPAGLERLREVATVAVPAALAFALVGWIVALALFASLRTSVREGGERERAAVAAGEEAGAEREAAALSAARKAEARVDRARAHLADGCGQLRTGMPLEAAQSLWAVEELLGGGEVLAPRADAVLSAARRALRLLVGTSGFLRELSGKGSGVFGADPELLLLFAQDQVRTVLVHEGSERGTPRRLRLSGNIRGIARQPSAEHLLIACERELRLLQLSDLRTVWRVPEREDLPTFSPDGRLVASVTPLVQGADHGAISVRGLANSKALRVLKSDARGAQLNYVATPSCLAFSPSSQAIVVGYGDGTLSLWSLAGQGQHMAAAILKSTPQRLCFTPEGGVLIGDLTGGLHFWNPGKTQPVALGLARQSPVCSMAWAPKRRLLAVGHDNGNIDVWHLTPPTPGSGGTPLRLLTLHQRGRVATLSVSPGEEILVSGTAGGLQRVWRLDSVRVSPGGGAVAISSDGERRAWLGSRYYGLDQVHVRGPSGAQTIELGDRRFYRRVRQGLAFSPKGDLLLVPLAPHPSAKEASRVEVWRVDGERPTRVGRVASPRPGPVVALDEERFVVGLLDESRFDRPGSLERSLISRKEAASELRWHAGGVLSLAASPEQLASAACDGTVAIWSRRGRRRAPLKLLTRTGVIDVSERLVADPPPAALDELWKELGGRPNSPKTHQWASAVAFGPKGEQVAVGYGDGVVRVFGPAGEVKSLFGHSGRVVGCSFLGASLLVSAAGDGRIRLWDLESRRQLQTITLGSVPTHFAASAGRVLVSTSDQRVWEFDLRLRSDRVATREALAAALPGFK